MQLRTTIPKPSTVAREQQCPSLSPEPPAVAREQQFTRRHGVRCRAAYGNREGSMGNASPSTPAIEHEANDHAAASPRSDRIIRSARHPQRAGNPSEVPANRGD